MESSIKIFYVSYKKKNFYEFITEQLFTKFEKILIIVNVYFIKSQHSLNILPCEWKIVVLTYYKNFECTVMTYEL